VAVAGGLAFLASDPFGLSVANVTNPSAPEVLGSSDVPFFGRAVAVRGSRAVVVGQTEQGLQHLWVLDLSIASRPTVVGELSTTPNISTFSAVGVALNATGTLAAMTLDAGIAVVDLSNPTAPVVLGTCAVPARALAVAVNSAGTYAYVADGGSHLRIVNLSSRTVVGTLSTAGTQVDIASPKPAAPPPPTSSARAASSLWPT
jgi:hypothetical protein